jgi:hypothetical protein
MERSEMNQSVDENFNTFVTHFERLGELSDLVDAISTFRDAVDLTPDGRPVNFGLLNNVGNSFKARFEHLRELSGLEDAISRQRDAVDLTPHGHPDKPGRLNNLGNSFLIRLECLGELSDLKDAISRQRDTVASPLMATLTNLVVLTTSVTPSKLVSSASGS